MKTFTGKTVRPLLLALSLAALAGCGSSNDNGDSGSAGGNTGGGGTGGGSGGGTTVNPVPASALASSDAFIAYVRQIIASNSDTAEPVPFGGDVNGPTNNTGEPAAL